MTHQLGRDAVVGSRRGVAGDSTGLLVSVRSAAEAEAALAGGADVIDVKEPSRGALGPADPRVWSEVCAVVTGRAAVSVALGELISQETASLAAAVRGPAFAKIGLAGCHGERGWISRWRAVVRALAPDVYPVPVAYADWPAANAPSLSVALALAAHSRARLLLVDTRDKRRGGLLDHLSFESLAELAADARSAEVRLVLAGSLDQKSIERLLPLRPALIGVRGAACRGGREGALDPALVKSLAAFLHCAAGKAGC